MPSYEVGYWSLLIVVVLLGGWTLLHGITTGRRYHGNIAPVLALFYYLEHEPWYLRKPDTMDHNIDGLNSHSLWTLSDESDFEPALSVVTCGKSKTARLYTLHPKMEGYMDEERLEELRKAVAPWWKLQVSQPKNGESVG